MNISSNMIVTQNICHITFMTILHIWFFYTREYEILYFLIFRIAR